MDYKELRINHLDISNPVVKKYNNLYLTMYTQKLFIHMFRLPALIIIASSFMYMIYEYNVMEYSPLYEFRFTMFNYDFGIGVRHVLCGIILCSGLFVNSCTNSITKIDKFASKWVSDLVDIVTMAKTKEETIELLQKNYDGFAYRLNKFNSQQ